MADARAAASIFLAIAQHHAATSLADLAAITHAQLGSMSADDWNGCHRAWSGTQADIPLANPNAGRDHPFYSREIAFTGALSSMTREVAWERVAAVGGQPEPGVTKHTNILVVGYQDSRVLRPGESLSAKVRKAQALRAKGQAIEVMGEVDFLQLLAL